MAPAAPEVSRPRIASEARVGNWACVCGQDYRVLTEPLTFWPRNSTNGYPVDPITHCVICGIPLDDQLGLEAAWLVSSSLL
jgi:hypothetical protein